MARSSGGRLPGRPSGRALHQPEECATSLFHHTRDTTVWLGDSRETIRTFPENVRQVAGFQLWRVQRGLEPNDWKPMPSVGLGVQEVRIHTDVEHRVLYVAKFTEAVYVLHAFEERTRRTPQKDLDLAKRRLRSLINQRARVKG
jgi:phage-related protein